MRYIYLFSDAQLIVIAKSDDASDVCIKAAKHILETRGIYLADNATAVKPNKSGLHRIWESIRNFLDNPPKSFKPIAIISLIVIAVAALIIGSNNSGDGQPAADNTSKTFLPLSRRSRLITARFLPCHLMNRSAR